LQRLAAPFDRLRDAADAFAAKAGHPPRVFLASLGALSEHAARSTFAANFLAAGGIEAVTGPELHTAADAADAFAKSGTRVACIAGSDQLDHQLAEATAHALKAAGAAQVLLAGRPGAREAQLAACGVDGFIHAGCDSVAMLGELQAALGIHKGA
jgi:methylmalonyl-CoA mutase